MTVKRYSLTHRIIAAVLSFVLVFSLAPAFGFTTVRASDNSLNIVPGSKLVDDPTVDDWMQFFGPGKMDTEFAGAVWTDKSVFAGESDLLPGVTLNKTNNFLVALSAIAGNYTITGHATVPTDTMLVLDLSGSMLIEREYGPFNNGNMVDGIDVSNVTAMLEATNSAIAALMEQNKNNRVGVILYSGNAATDEAATPNTATVLLPLGRYDGVAVGGKTEYLSLNGNATTRNVYENRGSNWRPNWQPTNEQVTYYTGNVYVKVADGLKTESGGSVASASKRVNGGTYVQNGLYKAMQEFLKVTDTVVPEGNPQAGVQRMPVIVLMSDGAPTIATTDYTNIGNSNIGDGTVTNDRITMLTQLTAAYVRGAIIDHYKDNPTDEQNMLFLTLGLGTSSNAAATNTLYPAGSGTTLTGYWDKYLAAQAGQNVQVITGSNSLTVTRNALVTAMNYVDKYFYAANAQEMIASFQQIVSEIQLKADTYNTLVAGGDADISGYVTFEDELGELMEVHQVKGILMSDGKGGVVLYTGKGIAQGMTTGVLGTVDGATDRGNELVRTVKERIPGLTTSMAQRLINNAYLDQQLYYESDTNWSNYIGWYADADGNYVGFWDKDSGYENAPAGAVYANKSYGYLGVEGNSDMMHVVVQVRTNLKTRHQTVLFKIPAALIPTVTYNVTLDKNDTSKVESLTREDALPMRLVFEVGMRSDLNAVNLEAKIAEHVANGGHVHKNADGTYSFYTNSWAVGNDKNSNGIPDPDEVATAVVAESHFNPALDNGRFYFTEDTLVLDAAGNVVTGAKPSGTTYQHVRAIYNATEKTYIYMPMSAETVAKAQQNEQGQWYIPAGSPYLEWSRFRFNKDENKTGTLDYTFVPAAFANNTLGIDIHVFLGNNGTLKLAPATGIALTKRVDGIIADAERYTFTVSVPAGVTASPVVTDANGQPLSDATVTAFANGSFDITIPADLTAYITGIPAGTAVTVTEKLLGDYHVSGITVNGLTQGAGSSVQVTVPALTDAVKLAQVEFTNVANGYGDLTVLKNVAHDLGTDPDVLATKVFTFKITLSGDRIHTGDTFKTSTGVDVKVAADGTLTYFDGTAITLHNEESVTVYRIPEGTSYTVEETDIPDGFVLDNAISSTGTIDANATDVADFLNRYPSIFQPVQIPLSVVIHKDLQGNPADEEIFEFALLQLLPDATDPEQKKVYHISSLATDKTVRDQSVTLEFADVGTYFYQIVEKIPANKTPGMTYSTTRALFAVVVTDADMNGVLEVDVREEANINAGISYTDPSNKETATGVSVEATFTNVYEVHSTSVSVGVHKELVNNTGVNIPLTSFRFGLYAVDANGNATGDPIQIVTSNALGNATFNIVITEARDLTYIIKEIVPSPTKAGMTYDNSEYVLSIDVTAAMDGQLSAVSSVKRKGSDTETPAVFRNTYALTPASATVSYSKNLVGRNPLEGETFTFQIVRTDAAYQPLTGEAAYSETYTVPVGQHEILLGQELFTKVGTYHFTLTEVAGNTAGLRYDSSVYHITVTVTDNGQGALVAASPVIHKMGQAAPVASAAFVNTYSVTGSGSVVIDGRKTLSGREIIANEFRFGLYTDLNGDPVEIVTNRADGSFVFSALHFTAADLDTGNGTKAYTYYVREILPTGTDAQGVIYDTTVHTVTVTVSHDSYGNLVVTPSENHSQSIVINNVYSAQGVDVTLHGMKLLVGDWSAVQNKTFSFQLFEADENYRVTNTTPIQVTTNSTTGEFSFGLSFADGEEGDHYYILREDISAAAGGVNYDATIYRVMVKVTDPGNGKLSAMIFMYHPGTGNVANDTTLGAPVAVFSNSYSVGTVQVILEGKKILTGRDLAAGEFTFSVLEGTKVVATGTNAADGTITFTPITYAKPGVHTYTIREDAGTLGGVSYDDAVFAVTVTVTDNGQGQLITSVNYGTEVVFENTYTADDTDEVTFGGEKNLTGRNLAAGEFAFVLKDDTGAVIETVSNDVDGKFTFASIRFDKVGVYKYTISEVAGTLGGVTYDGSEFTVTVTVTDPGDGKLVASVAYSAPVVFNNQYVADKTDEVIFGGEKNLTGRDLAAGEFEFVLKDETGATIETVKNAAGGKFAFTGIRYDKVGTYKYTISEVMGTLGGVTYDHSEFTVIVTVTDWGTGKLQTEVVYEIAGAAVDPDEVVFTNSYSADKTDEVTFGGDKVLTGRDLAAGEFEFVLKDETGATIETVRNTAGGKITFTSISFDKAGVYKYTISEVAGTLGGVTYDGSVFTVTVTVTDPGNGKLTASVAYSAPVVFNNKYVADKTDEVTFGGEKNLTGRDLAAGEFAFVLKDDAGAVIETVRNDVDGKFTFASIRFDKVGVYKYTISEVAGTLGGVTYDGSEFTVTVTVTDPGDGKLVASVAYSAPVVFNNQYVADKTDEVIFTGNKNLTGRDLAAGEFSFVLMDASGTTVEIVQNTADGKITFAGIAFDRAGVYKYTISEVPGALGGVTYDDSEFTVTVTVTDPGDGKLTASVAYSASVVFNNTYKAELVDFTFEADKHLIDISGGGKIDLAVPADRYEFLVKDALDNVLATVKADANGKISIALPYTAVATGHTFFLSEKAGTDEGVTYDLSVYKVTYDLVDNGDGTITPENITITRIKDAKGNDVTETATAMVFENTYKAADAQLDLFGQKHFNGGRDMVAGEFSFVLKDEAGAEVEVVTNDAKGVFFFKTLTFDTVGTYKYTISEVKGTDTQVTYDETVYEITVTVTYTNGVMKAVATVGGESVQEYGFTNIFTPDDVTVSIDVQKILDNKTNKVIGLDGFTFQLKGVGNDTDLTADSDALGVAKFSLTFAPEDIGQTFTYNLTEVAGNVAHMTYDETVYEIVVAVTQDSTTGALELTVTRNGEAVTDSATFTNVYFEEPPKTADIAHPAIAAMMGMAAVAMLAVLVIGKKKFTA